jgi:hypothetical protein
VIVAFSRREIGQPALALFAAVSNAAWSMPGTRATTSRCTPVTVKPASVLSIVTVACVRTLSGGVFAFVSCAESAIEKQSACAAAINSSGFVPIPSSKRVLNEYCVSLRTPLSVEIVPLPSLSPPFHWAEAFRLRAIRSLLYTIPSSTFLRWKESDSRLMRRSTLFTFTWSRSLSCAGAKLSTA